MAHRRLQGRVRVVVRPPTALGDDRDVVRADGPVGCALAPEVLVVHVLVHVEQGVDAVVSQQLHGGGDMAQVLLGNGLVPFADSARGLRRSRRADLGLVGPARSRLEGLPLDPEPNDVEAEPLHFGGVRRIEVPRLAGIGVRDVGRVLVDDVDAVHDDDPSLGVIEIRTPRGAQVARDARPDPLRLHATTALVLHALALERHDMRRQRIDVGLVDDVLRRRGRGGRRNDGRRGRGSGRCHRRRRRGARRDRASWPPAASSLSSWLWSPPASERPWSSWSRRLQTLRRPRRAAGPQAMRATPARTIDLG